MLIKLSTGLKGGAPAGQLPEIENMRVAIVAAEWNGHVTSRLTEGALEVLEKAGFDMEENVSVFHVPGAVELTFAASQLIEASLFDAVIVFGCVIRGGTPHFDYVCDIPVIFGVLTVDTEQDALDRAGGPLGNKGAEAAEAAIKMVDFKRKVEEL